MQTSTLIRLCGLSAILAGALRILASFIPFFTSETVVSTEILYLLIDILILFGLLGIYGSQNEGAGYFGFAGFLLAMTGTALIVGPDGKLGDLDVYRTGVMLITGGMLLLAIGSLRARVLSYRAPALWILSTLFGISGTWIGGRVEDYGFVIAGVAFGLGFVVAGLDVWKRREIDNH
ncbi:MAG: hypothetical protein IPM66_10410 [Acidobacteriota bacterium]|nr:MAG: hypothetical protein IPM66_10410 [Acidobacteriota bacterium]